MKLSVLQWNVWFKERADNVVSLVKETDADIVCLQEVTRDSADNPGRDIVAEIKTLGYYAAYEAIRISYGDSYLMLGDAIFSKLPMSGQRHVYIQREDPRVPGSEDRLYVEATLGTAGKALTVGTAHLSYSPAFQMDDDRKKEADLLFDAILPHNERFILTGDFNAKPDSYIVKWLGKVLQAAGPDYSQPTWTTKPFAYNGFEATTLDWRLDYVFTTPDIKVLGSKILHTEYSDHLPILATIEV